MLLNEVMLKMKQKNKLSEFSNYDEYLRNEYKKILKIISAPTTMATKNMIPFMKAFDIPEMHCSKGPVYFPLREFGLIPPKECKSDFIDLVNKAALIHWNEVKTWLTQKRPGCLRGAKQPFDDNVKYFVPNMSIEWSLDEKLYSVDVVIQNLASYNLYVDHDFSGS